LTSACSALVRGVAAKREVKAETSGFISDLRRKVALTGRFPWFRRFLVARFLFLSVELATIFYSIHAASLHSEKAGSLSAFVIASSLGFIVGGPLWGWLINKNLRSVFVLGGIAGAGAAILALCIA
jgi:MFS family permease